MKKNDTPLFGEIRKLTEEEKEELDNIQAIRDDDDLDFEERLVKAVEPANQDSTDLPAYLQVTNNN